MVAGDISLRIGRRRLRLGAGESATVPPGTAHSFRVCGGEAARLINESRPPLDTKECFVETFELDRSADPSVRQAGRPDADRAEIPTRVSFTRRRGDLAHLRQHLTDISFDELIARAERQRILIEPFRHRAGEDALEVIRAGPDVGRQRAGAAPTA